MIFVSNAQLSDEQQISESLNTKIKNTKKISSQTTKKDYNEQKGKRNK